MSPTSSTTLRKRPAQTPATPMPSGPVRHDRNPSPNPKPIFQFLAIGLIVFLGFLQFLPASHFRDPSDPLRNWIPFNSTSSSTLRDYSSDGSFNSVGSNDGEDGLVHVVSWIQCLDLRMLAVLANSTLSNSRYPDLIYFHFFTPEGNKDQVSFHKLKVLFPNSRLEIHGQEEVKELIRTVTSEAEYAKLNLGEIAPFVIPSFHQLLRKFIYVSPNVILKGSIEDLTGVHLSLHAVAAAEDCSKRLNTYVNYDVLEAIQRSASNPWVSETPYLKDYCIPDISLLLIDARKLDREFLAAFLWWSKVLNWSERSSERNPAIALVLYDKYHKLSDSWLVKNSTSPQVLNMSMITHYDGPRIVCSEPGIGIHINQQMHNGNLWTQYLPPLSNLILSP
ncbi:hypothetical protein SLE2022_306780 [Rubroshorea leprosula]